eukprot:TRINITY_DN3402_c0_g9_i1.p2 TRINITY_DN3402_c0_g9~~TRINITY_DN3402_c0_g9_i1.p2  ORF type:complete len:133 (-),score=22.84 TRINITY_DN3402_c0_g9_i1:469-867(-)
MLVEIIITKMKRSFKLITALMLVVLTVFLLFQFNEIFAFLFVSSTDSNENQLVAIDKNGTHRHFALTLQCMLLILLPMYINMFFSLFASHESDHSTEATFRCSFNPEMERRMKELLNKSLLVETEEVRELRM